MPLAAGFQLLHCIHFDGDVPARNTLVDGAAAAARISDEARDVLLRTLTEGRYFDDTIDHRCTDTVLKLDAYEPTRLAQLRFNNEDRVRLARAAACAFRRHRSHCSRRI